MSSILSVGNTWFISRPLSFSSLLLVRHNLVGERASFVSRCLVGRTYSSARKASFRLRLHFSPQSLQQVAARTSLFPSMICLLRARTIRSAFFRWRLASRAAALQGQSRGLALLPFRASLYPPLHFSQVLGSRVTELGDSHLEHFQSSVVSVRRQHFFAPAHTVLVTGSGPFSGHGQGLCIYPKRQASSVAFWAS